MRNPPDLQTARALYEANEEKFALFEEALIFANARFNLTAITRHEEVLYKHFLDSLAGEGYFPQGAKAIEVGSGAGFPSVPLMIARPDLEFTLVESTGKKCAFLNEIKEKLGLRAEIFCARAEELGKDMRFREKFDVCCARAVAPLGPLAEYCLPFVREGGLFVAYKGAKEEAKRAISLLGAREEGSFAYELPEGYGRRTLQLFTKIAKTPPKYPRGNGAERRAPLS